MRDKSRYILVESSEDIEKFGIKLNDENASKNFSRVINKYLLFELGDINYTYANPKVAAILNNKFFIIKSLLKGTPNLIIALAFIKQINDVNTAFYTIKTSGTIRTLKEYADGLNQNKIIDKNK